jgi:hypothetical protein
MNRSGLVWAAFGACAAVVLGVMLFFTVQVLRLERSMAESQAQAALEENVRLALWRMDSAAAVLLRDDEPRSLAANRAPPSQQQGQVQQRFEQQSQTMISQQEFQQREAIAPKNAENWRSIEPALVERIADILPGAKLEPAEDKANADDTRRLASVPARLLVPASARPDSSLPWNTPLRLSLMTAWLGVIAAA